MFTGLVQDIGVVEQVLPSEGMTDLWIRTQLGAADFAHGESVAVDGACLTVVDTRGTLFLVQASMETLRCTTLTQVRAGSRVNLERALTLGARMGGHLVQGHVDQVSRLLERKEEGGALLLAFSLSRELAPYFIGKGSVTVDGVSLTVNVLEADRFWVALIPETQSATTLAQKTVGSSVNVEADMIGKYVARLFSLRQESPAAVPGLTEAVLRSAGFSRT